MMKWAVCCWIKAMQCAGIGLNQSLQRIAPHPVRERIHYGQPECRKKSRRVARQAFLIVIATSIPLRLLEAELL